MNATKPINSYTKQEAFDTMVAHLRRQGKPSVLTGGSSRIYCAYRGADGSKCAVGCLIPDDDYKPSFERLTIVGFGQLRLDLTNVQVNFLSDAQHSLHDQPFNEGRDNSPFVSGGPTFLTLMERGAEQLAARYNLIYTPPVGEPA